MTNDCNFGRSCVDILLLSNYSCMFIIFVLVQLYLLPLQLVLRNFWPTFTALSKTREVITLKNHVLADLIYSDLETYMGNGIVDMMMFW